ERGLANPMRALALMTVKRALPLISPGYNLGVSEDEMRAQYRRFFEVLWSGARTCRRRPADPSDLARDRHASRALRRDFDRGPSSTQGRRPHAAGSRRIAQTWKATKGSPALRVGKNAR